MRKILIAAGVLVCVGLTVGIYLPKQGQAALQVAQEQYQNCNRAIIDPAPGYEFSFPPCFDRYMKQREAILWRYFFFQTLATHL